MCAKLRTPPKNWQRNDNLIVYLKSIVLTLFDYLQVSSCNLLTTKLYFRTIPKIGDTITAKVNNLGKCYVLGYLLQDEWISIIVKPLNPPEWFINQNGKSALATLFWAEIK